MKNQLSPPSLTVASTTPCGIDHVSYTQCKCFGPQCPPEMSAEAPPVNIATLSFCFTRSPIANAADDNGTSVIKSTPSVSIHLPEIAIATSGLSCRSADTTSTG